MAIASEPYCYRQRHLLKPSILINCKVTGIVLKSVPTEPFQYFDNLPKK